MTLNNLKNIEALAAALVMNAGLLKKTSGALASVDDNNQLLQQLHKEVANSQPDMQDSQNRKLLEMALHITITLLGKNLIDANSGLALANTLITQLAASPDKDNLQTSLLMAQRFGISALTTQLTDKLTNKRQPRAKTLTAANNKVAAVVLPLREQKGKTSAASPEA